MTKPHNLPKYTFPGDGYMYVICDMCGRKVRQMDTVALPKNPYNQQSSLVVCTNGCVDKLQPQLQPTKVRERLLPNPSHIRSEQADTYATNSINDRVPSAPQLPVAKIDPLYDFVNLFWIGPSDPGSSRITGYRIQRADPQDSIYVDISANTGNNTTFFQDLTMPVTGFSTYQIAAISAAGQGAWSVQFAWPYQIDLEYFSPYLSTSDSSNVLVTSDTGLNLHVSGN